MSSSKTAIAIKESKKLITIELYEALYHAVNMDSLEFDDLGFPDWVLQALERYEKEYGKKST